MAVYAPADKRFRRAHVAPVRRRRLWGSSWLFLLRAGLILMAVAYGGYRLTGLVVGPSALRIDHIVVRGNEQLSIGEVLALVGGLHGENILVADLDAGRRRLASSPWVREAALRRLLPSTIEVVLSERSPVGLGRVGGRLYLVDAGGTIIDEYGPRFAELDLPIIDGLASASEDTSPVIDEVRANLAARLIEEVSARTDLADRISQIDVADARDAVVILTGDPALIHLGHERFLERLQSYVELAPALRARVPHIDYVDLRFDERVYVRPAGSIGERRDPLRLAWPAPTPPEDDR